MNATLALADPDFWTSPGYRIAGWRDPLTHPTLAQSLAYDLLLWNEPASTGRAVHERMLAAQMTANYGRERIMEWYLNTVDYGHYAYGAEAAARLYLGKSVTQIDLGEAALLAAISQAPALNPIDVPQGMEERRIHVLQVMMEQGLITPAETAQAVLNRPSLHTPASIEEGSQSGVKLAPAFISFALSQLDARYGAGRMERGGLTILTSLDYDLQLQAVCAVQTEIAQLAGATRTILTLDGTPCEAGRLLPAIQAGRTLPDASASAILLDPQSGQILAAVGDIHGGSQAASLASHPAGTVITPFIYLTGFSRGLNPATLGWDIPGSTPSLGQVYHGPVRFRTALANDYLPPAITLLDQMSQDSVKNIAASFGLEFPSEGVLLQDDFDLSPLSLAEAYGIFADSGEQAGQIITNNGIKPVTVLQVKGVDHSTWADWTVPQSRSVVSPQLAYLVNQVLSDETARWPTLGHPNPLEIGRPAGAKLSPALDHSSAWTVGYTPSGWLSFGWEWVLEWRKTPANRIRLLDSLPKLWHALMQYTLRDLPVESWELPAGLVTVSVCDPSGLLPTAACPNVVSEIFLEGRQPVQADNLYQTVQVNIETGLLATVFTQPELVEKRTYMVVPPQARSWARDRRHPHAADGLRYCPEAAGFGGRAHFTHPKCLQTGVEKWSSRAARREQLPVSYRLEYGQGLYPHAWVQIGTDNAAPVTEGPLGKWDTTWPERVSMPLRLMVVRSDQR